jgi:hypothetical protein
MYVASLNIDWFFKKVFSDKRIAKRFLQDLLRVKITEITLVSTDYKLSDDAVIVRFDFRCTIKGKPVQIEMQQRYKTDVIKRFYLYHCVNTAVQLETLEPIVITKQNGDTYTEKNYHGIQPVITIIWMVDDTLKFEDDIITFTTLPEAAKDFISDKDLWSLPLEDILKAREKTLKILNNKTKNLDFFTENKLIYLFQGNIFKHKPNTPLFKWIDVAQKSRNPNNTEADFAEYKDNKIMAEVLKRLKRDELQPDEQKMADYIDQFENSWQVALVLQNREMEQVNKKLEKANSRAIKAEDKAIKAEDRLQEGLLKAVNAFLMLGKDIPYIADILSISIEETQALVNKIEAKKS